MSQPIFHQSSNRPLFINFELYTDGDADFKRELIYSIIDNLKEVQVSLLEAMKNNNLEIFEKTCHKIKPTLILLDDNELLHTIQSIKMEFANHQNEELVTDFGLACLQIILSLEKEL